MMRTNIKNYFPITNVEKLLNIKQTNLKVQHLFAFLFHLLFLASWFALPNPSFLCGLYLNQVYIFKNIVLVVF